MRKATIYDNSGKRVEVWADCNIGDEFRCLISRKGLEDGGDYSFVFEVDQQIKGKIYKVASVSRWGGVNVPRIIDDNGCSSWLETDEFEPVYEIENDPVKFFKQ